MEDSEFSSDFANSFLGWEDGANSPAPSDVGENIQGDARKPTGTSTVTQHNTMGIAYLMGQQVGNSSQNHFNSIQQTMAIMQHNHMAAQLAAATGPAPGNSNMSHSAVQQAPSAGSSAHPVSDSHAVATSQPGAVGSDSKEQPQMQLHPLGIQSSAICPPHLSAIMDAGCITSNTPSFMSIMYNPMLQSQLAPNHQFLAMVQAQHQQQMQYAHHMQAQHAQVQQIQAQTHVQQQEQQQQQQQQQQLLQAQQQQQQIQTQQQQQQQIQTQQQQKQKQQDPSASVSISTEKTGSQSANHPSGTKSIPPFYLFDAPCELRANFLQSQRMHNLPISADENSFHYGMAVNGFHPQMNNAQVNPVLPLSGSAALPPGVVQLIDARSRKNRRGGKERNEREQKRAQKITELIEEIRVNMEHGGWKVEMKSKYHTLSTCADYVKHLADATKEKEEAVKRAKSDLEMKERKIEVDKALDSRSDPESVTSSLSADSSLGKKHANRKRKTAMKSSEQKKVKLNDSSSEGSDEHDVQGDSKVRNVSLDKMSSTMSDMTDSNKDSSESYDCEKNSVQEKHMSSTSISSTAAVAYGTASHTREHGHADVVIKKTKKARKAVKLLPVPEKCQEATSLDPNFELDFEEVFVTSNVPQLIATPAGRIVACNTFFEKATGLTKNEISRLTIFSIVKQDKLSSLFEMVAEALRGDRRKQARLEQRSADSSGNTTGDSGNSSEEQTTDWDYAAMTLPCISFPSRDAVGKSNHPHPLYMTMTLLSDDDPRKRCFHCIITDNPGTNGNMGFITPKLLALLFSEGGVRPTKISSQSKMNVDSSVSESDNNRNSSSSSGDVSVGPTEGSES